MKGKWIKIVLVASLAFNVAFVAAMVYKKSASKTLKPEETFTFKTEFNLNDTQRIRINKIMKKFKIDLLKFKQDILEKRMDIIEELGDADLNIENIDKMTEELNELEKQLNLIFVDTLVQINNILDTKQRINFLYKLSKNWFFVENGSEGERNE